SPFFIKTHKFTLFHHVLLLTYYYALLFYSTISLGFALHNHLPFSDWFMALCILSKIGMIMQLTSGSRLCGQFGERDIKEFGLGRRAWLFREVWKRSMNGRLSG
ncbi:hypothetical protein LINPERPRIM_LOCUS17250, partial [Linum perenne]